MRKEDVISVNGTDVKVKELTVAEVRHWLMDMIAREKAKEDKDIVSIVMDQGLLKDIGLSDIVRMTNMTPCQIDHFAPSELKILVEKCKELNPDFFGMRGRLLDIAMKQV